MRKGDKHNNWDRKLERKKEWEGEDEKLKYIYILK